MGTTTPKTFPLLPGFRGFVAGVVNADLVQRALVEVKEPGGQPIASVTFEGVGSRVIMRDRLNQRESWSFGPFNFDAVVVVTITHQSGSGFVPSQSVGPLSIKKAPEPDYPMTFNQQVVISEDATDQDHDDCTISVLEYK